MQKRAHAYTAYRMSEESGRGLQKHFVNRGGGDEVFVLVAKLHVLM